MTVTFEPTFPDFPVARLSVEQYHEMIEHGVLNIDDRLELLEGWLVPKVTNNPPHAGTVQQVADVLFEVLRGTPWSHRVQLPVTLARSEPEPDIAVVVRGDYRRRHPQPDDVLAVIEVSDSSLADDRVRKARIYAGGGIATYAVINLSDGQVEVLTGPVAGGDAVYAERAVLRPGDILVLDEVTVSVADLLG